MLEGLLETALDGSGATALRAAEALGDLKAGPKALTRALADERPHARARAARALGQIRHDKAGAKLLAMLDDGAPAVRAGAAEALGRLGDTSRALALTALLNDSHADVRRAGVTALGDLGASDAAEAVVELLDDPVAAVRRAAATALAACGASGREGDFRRRLGDPDAGVRAAAAKALAGAREAESADALDDLLQRDRVEAVRVAAAATMTTLVGVDDPLIRLVDDRSKHVRLLAVRAVKRLQLDGATGALLVALREGPQREVRAEAARALGGLGAQEAVEGLTLALVDDDPELQGAAEEALRNILGKSADPGALRADGHIALERWEDAAALGKAALRPLIRALGDPRTHPRNTSARCGAARALGSIGRKEGTPALVSALKDYSPRVRTAACEALGRLGDHAAQDGLVGAASDVSAEVRAAAISALGILGDAGAVEAVLAAVGDPETPVRRAALLAVTRLGSVAIEVARKGLESPSPDERVLAVQGLGALPDAEARDALHEGLTDHSGLVRQAARQALVEGGWRPVGLRARRTDPGFARWTRYSEWATTDAPGEGPDQVALLIEALDDDEGPRRRAAAETLGECGDARAEAPLRGCLNHPDIDLAAVAGLALVRLGVAPGDGPEWAAAHVAAGDWTATLAAGAAALPALITELHNPDASVRVAALRVAALLNEPGSAAVALQAWDDRDDEVRGAARRALGELSPEARSAAGEAAAASDERWVAGVVATARDGTQPADRATAIDLLANVQDPRTNDAMAAALNGSQPLAQAAALRAVARRRDGQSAPRVAALVSRAPTAAMRIQAAETLALVGGQEAIPALSALLLSSDLATSTAAEELLSTLMGPNFDRPSLEIARLLELERFEAAATRGRAAAEPLRRIALDSAEPRRRRAAAARALGAVGGPAAIEALRILAQETDPPLRVAACEALAELSEDMPDALADGNPEVRAAAARTATPEELAGLLHDPDPRVIQASIEGLVRQGRDAAPVLIDALNERPVHPSRRLIVEALGAVGDPAATDPLIAVLEVGDPGTRHAARQALVACGWRPVGLRAKRTDPGFARWTLGSEWRPAGDETPQVQVLTAALKGDADPVRRRIAAETLGDIPAEDPNAQETALPGLVEALAQDDDVDVRIVAAQSAVALGAAPDPDDPGWAPFWAAAGRWEVALAHGDAARPALVSMLTDGSARVRLGAVQTLAAAGLEDALEALRPLADDRDAGVRKVVMELLDEADW